jgi:hypothetical protein
MYFLVTNKIKTISTEYILEAIVNDEWFWREIQLIDSRIVPVLLPRQNIFVFCSDTLLDIRKNLHLIRHEVPEAENIFKIFASLSIVKKEFELMPSCLVTTTALSAVMTIWMICKGGEFNEAILNHRIAFLTLYRIFGIDAMTSESKEKGYDCSFIIKNAFPQQEEFFVNNL